MKYLLHTGYVMDIPLTQGKVAYIDTEDYPRISKHKWSTLYRTGYPYAHRKENYILITIHREILNITNPNIKIDHINRNGLDNRKCNLRIATQSQNNANSVAKGGTSKYKEVSYNSKRKVWIAQITLNYRNIYIGQFHTEEQAALAYNQAARILFGEFALLNDVEDI